MFTSGCWKRNWSQNLRREKNERGRSEAGKGMSLHVGTNSLLDGNYSYKTPENYYEVAVQIIIYSFSKKLLNCNVISYICVVLKIIVWKYE